MSKVVDLRQAVAGLARGGDAAAMEEFTHLIPMAAHEIIRQGRRDLTSIRMTPDLIERTAASRRGKPVAERSA